MDQTSKTARLNRRAATAIFSAIVALGTAPSAAAASSAGGTYRLRAYVPVACWVRPSAPLLAEAGRQGEVVEACNSPGGFTVTANYRPLTGAEQARLVYGGDNILLNSGGQQVLRQSNMATIRSVNYRFEDVSLNAPLVLALTIQPI